MRFSENLLAAGWSQGVARFALMAFGASVLLAIVLAFLVMQWDAQSGMVAFLAGLAAGFFSSWKIPLLVAERNVRALESQLGSVLQLLSVQLAFEPFEAALNSCIRRVHAPHPALQKLARDLDGGLPVLSALRRLNNATPSVLVKKAGMQLAFAYRQGDAAGLSALSEEFSQGHVEALHRFAARTAFGSVWFEALAALLPLLISAYVLVGASFLQFTFPSSGPFWLLAAALPLLNAALVGFVWLGAPAEG
ncbi:hypothetical protein HY994_05570 [Candidatus Micrarchaeota archaeon]|nr:hypothetical protein [Candidatus Micrarchaeota archaeon]